jgi:hypothetical protein
MPLTNAALDIVDDNMLFFSVENLIGDKSALPTSKRVEGFAFILFVAATKSNEFDSGGISLLAPLATPCDCSGLLIDASKSSVKIY